MPKRKLTDEQRKLRNAANSCRYVNGLRCTLEQASEIVLAKREAVAEKKKLRVLAQSHGVSANTLAIRMWRGWGAEKAATTPVRPKQPPSPQEQNV